MFTLPLSLLNHNILAFLRSTSASSCHRKDLDTATDSRITPDSTPVTGSALIAPAMTDTSSQTATKASSQQSSHHQSTGGNNYPLRSADVHTKKPLASGPLSPHDLKGTPLVSSASGGYSNSSSKIPNRPVYYNTGGNGVRGGRGGGNNTYRGYRPQNGRFNPNSNAIIPFSGRPQGENAVPGYAVPSPPQVAQHFAPEAQSLPPVIPSLVPGWTTTVYPPCLCILCQQTAAAAAAASGLIPNPHLPGVPTFAYYAPVQQQVQPNAPMAAQAACYPGYVVDD